MMNSELIEIIRYAGSARRSNSQPDPLAFAPCTTKETVMDTLGYTHMAAAYEELYGPLGLRSFELPRLKLTSAIAITTLILVSGLTALVGSAFAPNGVNPHHQAPSL